MRRTKYLKVAKVLPTPDAGESDAARLACEKGAAKHERTTSAQKDPPEPAVLPAPEKAASSPARPRAHKSAYDRSKAKFEMEWSLLQETAGGYDLSRPVEIF